MKKERQQDAQKDAPGAYDVARPLPPGPREAGVGGEVNIREAGVGGEVNLSLQDLSKTPKNAPRRLKNIKECPRMLRSQEKSKKFTSNYTKESQLMS